MGFFLNSSVISVFYSATAATDTIFDQWVWPCNGSHQRNLDTHSPKSTSRDSPSIEDTEFCELRLRLSPPNEMTELGSLQGTGLVVRQCTQG